MRKLHYDPFDGLPLRGSILHLLGEKESEVRSENDSEEEETYLAMSDIKHLMLGMPVEKYALETSAMFACFTVSPSPLP